MVNLLAFQKGDGYLSTETGFRLFYNSNICSFGCKDPGCHKNAASGYRDSSCGPVTTETHLLSIYPQWVPEIAPRLVGALPDNELEFEMLPPALSHTASSHLVSELHEYRAYIVRNSQPDISPLKRTGGRLK